MYSVPCIFWNSFLAFTYYIFWYLYLIFNIFLILMLPYWYKFSRVLIFAYLKKCILRVLIFAHRRNVISDNFARKCENKCAQNFLPIRYFDYLDKTSYQNLYLPNSPNVCKFNLIYCIYFNILYCIFQYIVLYMCKGYF